jgi:hypothetical protein
MELLILKINYQFYFITNGDSKKFLFFLHRKKIYDLSQIYLYQIYLKNEQKKIVIIPYIHIFV